MKRLLLLVEGQTEEEFVRDLLRPHLWQFNVDSAATRLCTSLVEGRRAHRGGGLNYDRLRRELQLLLHARPVAVSTLFDYYALPRNFPGLSSAPAGGCYQRVAHLESALAQAIDDTRFIPNLMLHEFEALLFADREALLPYLRPAHAQAELDRLLSQVTSPEEIDEGPETAPSKRLESLLLKYKKTYHGPLIAKKIGLEKMRASCPHFDGWVTRLEALGHR